MKKVLLLLLLFPIFAHAASISVKDELADMVEAVVKETNLNINIPQMTEKSININQIDGLDVCAPAAKEKVLKLQAAFNAHPNIYQNYSIYAIYIKKENGEILSFPEGSQKIKELLGECKFLYVSIR